MTWTPPTNVIDGTGWPADTFNDEVIGNLLHLYNSTPLWVGSPSLNTEQTFNATANGAVGFPFVCPATGTLAGFYYKVNSASGNMDAGVYEDDGNGTSCTKLKTNGGGAMSGAGTNPLISFSASQALIPGQIYWLWVAFSSAAASCYGTNGPSVVLWRTKAAAYPLPSTITYGAAPATAPALFGLLT